MPLPLRLVRGRQSQAGRVAVMRGPMLFGLGRPRNKDVGQTELRLLTVDPKSLEGPIADDSVRRGGMACRLRAWKPAGWYPFANPAYRLTLTEYADPAVELIYFHVPNPLAKEFCEDELVGGGEVRLSGLWRKVMFQHNTFGGSVARPVMLKHNLRSEA